MPLNRRHVWLIARYSNRYAIRGGVGLVFLFVALLFGLIVANAFLQPVEQITREAAAQGSPLEPKQVVDQMVSYAKKPVAWVLGSSDIDKIEDREARDKARKALDEWVHVLLEERPALLSGIVLVILWGWPFLVVMGAFNMFSGDIQSKGLRFQLVRADRTSIYWGRVVGSVLAFAVVLFVLLATITVYMGLRLAIYSWGQLLGTAALGLLALIVVSVPYLALGAWISVALDSPFASLTISSLVVGGVPLVAMLAGFQWEAARSVKYLLPWGYQQRLFHGDPSQVLLAVLLCLVHAGAFLWLGHRLFLKRDL